MKKKTYTYDEIREFARQIEYKEVEETQEILMRKDKSGTSVAHTLSYHSYFTKWSTKNKDILMLQSEVETSVAHELASWHLTWITDDLEILSLANRWGRTVEDTLVKRGKI